MCFGRARNANAPYLGILEMTPAMFLVSTIIPWKAQNLNDDSVELLSIMVGVLESSEKSLMKEICPLFSIPWKRTYPLLLWDDLSLGIVKDFPIS